MRAFTNGSIFDGNVFWKNHAVLTSEGLIVGLVPQSEVPSHAEIVDLHGQTLAPAFIDCQIYGGNGALFGVHPSVSALEATRDYCRSGGATRFLPTVATNDVPTMIAAIESVRQYWAKGQKGVVGLHLEGPYINVQKRGAHVAAHIKEHPSVSDVEAWLSAGKGIVKMMTLAPEVCSTDIVQLLHAHGIIVSAGHTNATYAQATDAFNGGISVATHLFNAMSPLQHREPGVVGAIFDHPTVRASLVADGFHVDFPAVRIAKKVMGERLFYITDAVTTNTEGSYPHQLHEGRYVLPDGTLSGSALTMMQCVKNGVEQAGFDPAESLRMAALYPAQVLGLDAELGRIAAGYRAEFVAFDADFRVLAVYD